MRLTLLVTIDSVKPLQLLDILIHSLNLQTSQDFDVVFFNQTPCPKSHLRRQLRCAPRFPHSYWTLPPSDFLGDHPLWDLYAFHTAMLDEGRIGDYLMSLHMEEFLDSDYIEEVIRLLDLHSFDILFGNLRRTSLPLIGRHPSWIPVRRGISGARSRTRARRRARTGVLDRSPGPIPTSIRHH